MPCECEYKYIGPWRGSKYRQFFYKERKVRAMTLWQATLAEGEEAMSPEEVAYDYDVPLEAVLESIDYCEKNMELLQREVEEDEEIIRRNQWDKLPHERTVTTP